MPSRPELPSGPLNFVGGAAVEGSGPEFSVLDPATGQPIVDFTLAGPADVDTAVAAARAAFPDWSRSTPGERSTVMHTLAAALTAMADQLSAVESAIEKEGN